MDFLDYKGKQGRIAIDKACQIAIDHQNYTYTFMKNILENKMTEQQPILPDKPLPTHGNLRGKEHYQKQLKLKFNNQ